MAKSSFDRDAFRRNLSAALSESLLDTGDIEDVARRAQANVHAQNPFAASPNMAFFLAASSSPAQPFFPQQQQQPQLLLAVARQQEQVRLLEQARAAVIVAQERERLLMQQSYQALLQNKLCVPSGPPSFPKITDALRYSLFSQVTQQQPNNLAALVSQGTNQNNHGLALCMRDTVPSGKMNITISPAKALEALGSRLRNAVDPYIDVSSIVDEQPSAEEEARQAKRTRGGVTEPFPEKLHRVLKEVEAEGNADIVSFFSHGRAFAVHDMERFVEEIMPRFFKQSKWNSFARQLNLYGFQRLLTGPDAGGYYHELFLKGRPSLAVHMRRVGVPHGKDRRKFKQPLARTVQPDFYAMKKLASES